MIKKIVFLFSQIILVNAVFGGIPKKTDNNWRKVDGNADGCWSDEAHWTLGMPGAEHYAYFPGALGSYTVTFPKGDVEIETSFRANVAEGETVTFDGRGSNFRQGAREVDTYHHEPFGFRYKGAHFFNHQQYSTNDSVIVRHAFSEMTNFVVRLAGDGGPKLYFDQGYLDLYKPCGSESWSALTILFAQGTGANADALPYDGVVGFGKNTETRFGTVYLQGNNRTNILEFTGGKHRFMSTLSAPDASQSMVNKETITEIRIADDAEVVFKGPMYFGHYGSHYGDTARRIFRLSAEDGGYCAVSNTLSQRNAGRLEVAVKNKAVMEFSGGVTLAGIAACTATVSFVDATVNINGEFKQGSSGRNASLGATNATLNISSSGSYAQVSSVSEFVDCSISAENHFVVSGDSSAVFSGENGNSLFSKAFYVGRTDSSDAEVDFSGGTHVFNGSIFIGESGNGSFCVSGGSVSNLSAAGGSAFCYLGINNANAFGTFSMSGGKFIMPSSNGIQVGYRGRGKLNVSGGEIVTRRIRLGSFESTAPVDEDVFEQSGGIVDLSYFDAGYGVHAAVFANRKARVSLTGGILKCGRLAAGAGTAEFYADGGTIEVPGANTEFFNGFSIAELGPKGLAIRSDYDITAAQEFTKAADGGRLVLSGSGVKTFTGEGTSLSATEIMDGKAVFPSGIAKLGAVSVNGGGTLAFAGEPPASAVTSLVLGDKESFGVLEVKAGSPVKVAGDVVVNAAKIVLGGDFAAGSDFRILEFAGEMSEESENRLAAAVAEGLAEGDVAEFSLVEEAGSRGISVKIRKRSDLTISLDAGVSNATENVSFAYGETLTAFAGAGAELTMSGVYGCGRFVKEGTGKVALTSGGSRFLDGILLTGGLLSLGDLNALVSDDPMSAGAMVLSNGTLEITAPVEGLRLKKPLQMEAAPTNMLYYGSYYKGRDAVVVKNDVPLTMPVPSPANAAFIKRGAAPMVIEAKGTVNFPAERGHDVFGYTPADVSEYVFDDYGNVPANFVYPALSVVDGELRLKGVGEEPAEFDIHGSLMLSVPTKSVAVQPSLVLDNARLVNKGNGTRAYLGMFNRSANSAVNRITLALTNNSVFSADTVHVNKSSSAGAKARISADSSDFIATYLLYAGDGSSPDIVYSFRNSSRLLAKSVSLNSTVTFDFDSSKFAKNTALDPVGFVAYGATAFNFNFRNGSEFICNSIVAHYDNMETLKINLLFNDSRWTPGADNFDFASVAAKGGTYVKVEGSGLVLEPPAGKTWTMGLPVSGDGGMVIGGEGRVLLDGSKWAALGAVKIMEGATLDLGGTTAEDLFVTGGGTLANGTVSGGVEISLKEDGNAADDGLPLLSNVSFAGPGRVKIALTGGALLPPYRTVAVARYEGAAPDVGSWRLVKNPADRTLGAKFTAENGKVYMTPGKYGTVLIVR